jgi:hypothetical protein
MDEENNILAYLVKKEDDVTRLLHALLMYKPFRDIVVKLFTDGQCDSSNITWDDIKTQIPIAGGRPDLSIFAEEITILVEVKTTHW